MYPLLQLHDIVTAVSGVGLHLGDRKVLLAAAHAHHLYIAFFLASRHG